MTNTNSTALFRSLAVYAVCVPLAIVMGYVLTSLSYMDYQSLGFVGVLLAVLIFPLLMKWHHPLLIFSWSCPLSLFFLPGRPGLFIPMVMASLGISIVERILDKNKRFIAVPAVTWPLVALLAVVLFTAKMTGGVGFHALGSNVYGGKKYAMLILGILSYFALTARSIPAEKANFYVLLYFSGSFLNFIGDLYPITPRDLQFIFAVFPAAVQSVDTMGNAQMELGVTRMVGTGGAAAALFAWMLARYGVRDIVFGGKFWRPVVLGLSFILIFTGGYRSGILLAVALLGMVFFFEKLHRTILLLPIVLFGIMASVAMVPLAPRLPHTFQRALAFLPLNIDPAVRIEAEGTIQWRLDMWAALLPQVPQNLLLGKGFAFSAETFNSSMGANATFKAIDASQDPLALSSDFHNGPLSVLIPFGIWGALAWLWFMVAGFRVVWRNYRYGDPAIRHANLAFFAMYVYKCFAFLFLFGAIADDVIGFAGIIGLSIALNHGMRRPPPRKTAPVPIKPRFAIPVPEPQR